VILQHQFASARKKESMNDIFSSFYI